MPGRVVIVTAALCAVAAVLGLALGLRSGPSETDVIEAGVALYRAETGGDALDCVGVPGRGRVWISVRCAGDGAPRTYSFDETGALMPPREEPST